MTSAKPSGDMNVFRNIFKSSKHILILTGAGVSAESGVPTFRGEGGFWRKYQAQNLATLEAFHKNPSLVWEFYHYRRELVLTKHPNPAHVAIAECEKRFKLEGRIVTVITQNIDELHKRAGTENIIELHGAPDLNTEEAGIPVEDLPRCTKTGCDGLLRPFVVWFGESLNSEDLSRADEEINKCDLCLVVGTSSIVYPAAMFAPQVASRGVPVAEFNLEPTPATGSFNFHFEGQCGKTIPEALSS